MARFFHRGSCRAATIAANSDVVDPIRLYAETDRPRRRLSPANQPAVAPTTAPMLSKVALRSGLRWAFEATPRAECRTVAFVAFFPMLRPNFAIDPPLTCCLHLVYPAMARATPRRTGTEPRIVL
jgi:hypothetical protein